MERGGNLGLRAEVAHTHCEDEREHDGHEQPAERENHPRDHLDVRHRQQNDDGIGDAVNRQQKVGFDHARNGCAGETSDRVKNHGEGDHIGGGGFRGGSVCQRCVPAKERSRGTGSGGVLNDCVFQDVVHGKCVYPDLRDDIKELGKNSADEMRLAGKRSLENRGVLARCGVVASLFNGGQFDQRKYAEDQEHHATQDNVGEDKRVEIRICDIHFLAEQEESTHRGRENVGARVECLRD